MSKTHQYLDETVTTVIDYGTCYEAGTMIVGRYEGFRFVQSLQAPVVQTTSIGTFSTLRDIGRMARHEREHQPTLKRAVLGPKKARWA